MQTRIPCQDKLPGKATRSRSKPKEHDVLLSYLRSDDTLVVAGVECLGPAEADVQWFLSEVSRIGAKIIVNGASMVVESEADKTDIIGRVTRHQKALHMGNFKEK